MNKTLLLDVDGVLIRDKCLLDHVKYNAVRYVSKKLPTVHASRTNSLLYKAYGHTAIGLEKEYDIDASDFDAWVYTPQLIEQLEEFIETSDEFKHDVKTIRGILTMGYDVELFSNAPLVWTEPVRRAIDDFRVNNGVYSKPNIDSYTRFDKSVNYVFVDDKMCNLLPSLFFKNWTPIHFSEYQESQFLPTINSLDSISKFL